eukprot:c2658_g1_i1.p2 GENE.c2658_g1_i1~~c2658_g1_i1.p2  ORF type:complete len:149 (+),score=0.03 c2658_g1_i1:227-673(+)
MIKQILVLMVSVAIVSLVVHHDLNHISLNLDLIQKDLVPDPNLSNLDPFHSHITLNLNHSRFLFQPQNNPVLNQCRTLLALLVLLTLLLLLAILRLHCLVWPTTLLPTSAVSSKSRLVGYHLLQHAQHILPSSKETLNVTLLTVKLYH